jgi:hypothetical protein
MKELRLFDSNGTLRRVCQPPRGDLNARRFNS